MSTPITAVLFDYGLVLTGAPDPAAWEQFKQVLSAAETPFHDAYWHFREDYDRGTLNAPSYWAAVAARLDHQLTEPELRKLVQADIDLWTVPNQPMITWAHALGDAGYRCGLLSNIGDAMEFGVLESHPWLSRFASLTFSHRYGFAKPEAALYGIAAEALGVDAGQILFIDDKPVNVEGARQAGMHAVRYTQWPDFQLLMQAQGFGNLLKPEPRHDAGAV